MKYCKSNVYYLSLIKKYIRKGDVHTYDSDDSGDSDDTDEDDGTDTATDDTDEK